MKVILANQISSKLMGLCDDIVRLPLIACDTTKETIKKTLSLPIDLMNKTNSGLKLFVLIEKQVLIIFEDLLNENSS